MFIYAFIAGVLGRFVFIIILLSILVILLYLLRNLILFKQHKKDKIVDMKNNKLLKISLIYGVIGFVLILIIVAIDDYLLFHTDYNELILNLNENELFIFFVSLPTIITAMLSLIYGIASLISTKQPFGLLGIILSLLDIYIILHIFLPLACC